MLAGKDLHPRLLSLLEVLKKTTQPVTTVTTANTIAAPTAKETTTPIEPVMKTTATTTIIAMSANETTTSTKAAATTRSTKGGKINLARGKAQ